MEDATRGVKASFEWSMWFSLLERMNNYRGDCHNLESGGFGAVGDQKTAPQKWEAWAYVSHGKS
jgi:hypothetical protein